MVEPRRIDSRQTDQYPVIGGRAGWWPYPVPWPALIPTMLVVFLGCTGRLYDDRGTLPPLMTMTTSTSTTTTEVLP